MVARHWAKCSAPCPCGMIHLEPGWDRDHTVSPNALNDCPTDPYAGEADRDRPQSWENKPDPDSHHRVNQRNDWAVQREVTESRERWHSRVSVQYVPDRQTCWFKLAGFKNFLFYLLSSMSSWIPIIPLSLILNSWCVYVHFGVYVQTVFSPFHFMLENMLSTLRALSLDNH